MAKNGYNTNLAVEFYVLSVLHRLGADARLTLGNKKSVDIAVIKGAGNSVTIDVKGLAGSTSWPVDNIKRAKKGHFIVFVCFNGKIAEPLSIPEIWVVPSAEVRKYTYISPNRSRRVVQRCVLRSRAEKYKIWWSAIV